MLVAEIPEDRRRWKAWAILDREGCLYRLAHADPRGTMPIVRLEALGWTVIEVDVSER